MDVLRRDLRAVSADGVAASAMIGAGEMYFPAFVLAISGSQIASGLVLSVPVVLGALLQLVSPFFLRRLGSYRRWVVLNAAVQVLSFIPLVVAAWLGKMSTAALFAVIAIYWATSLAGGASWYTWVEELVPARIRPNYFAIRTRFCQAGTVAGFVLGGWALQHGRDNDRVMAVFALLFLASAVVRCMSAHYLSTQSDPKAPDPAVRLPSRAELRNFLSGTGAGRIFLYLLAVQVAVQLSGPYFTPYMLRQLNLPYWDYMVLICTSFLAKIACLPAMGRIADRWDVRRLLWVGGIAIVPCSALWIFSDKFSYLLAVQVYGGIAWAAFELAMLLLVFEAIPSEKRVGMLSVYNLANAGSILVGSVCGGAVLLGMNESRHAYWILFGVSAALRLALLGLLFAVRTVPARVRIPPVRLPAAAMAMPGEPWEPERAVRPRKLLPAPAGK